MNLQLKNTESISLDTLGFAQVGNPDYYEKVKIEKKVIENFFKDNPKLAVPLNFVRKAYFKWELCPHDLGNYYDFTIVYDTDFLEELEKNQQTQVQMEFWDWLERCENALTENETELLNKCKDEYNKI